MGKVWDKFPETEQENFPPDWNLFTGILSTDLSALEGALDYKAHHHFSTFSAYWTHWIIRQNKTVRLVSQLKFFQRVHITFELQW